MKDDNSGICFLLSPKKRDLNLYFYGEIKKIILKFSYLGLWYIFKKITLIYYLTIEMTVFVNN